jgi:hypothetical protein
MGGVDRGAVVADREEGMMDELEAVRQAEAVLVRAELEETQNVVLSIEELRAILARATRAHD